MAKQILPAQSALMPATQTPLTSSVRTENRGSFTQQLQTRFDASAHLPTGGVLFDWEHLDELMREVAFVNEARERLDEAAAKVAPSMLRIVLTVKQHLETPKAQRNWLTEHVDWDFRRISELCIVAESYGLLEPTRRFEGEMEMRRYGWSCALKLAYVRDPAERQHIWDTARGGAASASYRGVLEELRRFRERKLIGPPSSWQEYGERIAALQQHLQDLTQLEQPDSKQGLEQALNQITQVQQELNALKRVLKERVDAEANEELARYA